MLKIRKDRHWGLGHLPRNWHQHGKRLDHGDVEFQLLPGFIIPRGLEESEGREVDLRLGGGEELGCRVSHLRLDASGMQLGQRRRLEQ